MSCRAEERSAAAGSSTGSRLDSPTWMPSDPSLRELATLLAGQGSGDRSLAELARRVGVSERSLFRKFQQQTGMSPGQWRRHAQVVRSMELLTNGLSVTQTALEVGYESTAAFIRAFRQVVGTTPHGYAQEQAQT